MARNLPAAQRKLTLLALAAGAIWLFGDDLLHLLLHWLHLALEVIESLLDDFFIEVVGLSHHSGEVATAYTGLSLALYLLYKLLRRVYSWWMKASAALLDYSGLLRQTRQARWVERNWRLVAIATAASTFAYFFMF
ncbi:hypothetical protein [Methylococcus sp. EFPC2]|uniref:hypothetical protein n=1 Tax=Methylococcus sp. EFPC2 TaxID=2812648 RepID=UPI001967614C|nr:hypothetical protein [Methylococcus sp. EFPC2]QSA97872.1 hypothetical protein JWZ97_03320 [Methylococcus sp. EFPC2]